MASIALSGTTSSSASNTDRKERRGHEYHAEANLLSGRLERPIVQKIPLQGELSLQEWRGGHLYQRVPGYDLEGLVSFKGGYTRVSGYRSQKKSNSFVTLATSVIEGLIVFDVLTADRVVAQVLTEHPHPQKGDLGHVPRVSFLGTQFTNLMISGYRVDVTVDTEICGDRRKAQPTYLEDPAFLKRVRPQAEKILKFSNIPVGLRETSGKFLKDYRTNSDIQSIVNLPEPYDEKSGRKLVCSLIKKISLPKELRGVEAVENVLYISDFGIVSLGSLEVGQKFEKGDDKDDKGGVSNYFTVKMLDMRLGCAGEGSLVAVTSNGNGRTKP